MTNKFKKAVEKREEENKAFQEEINEIKEDKEENLQDEDANIQNIYDLIEKEEKEYKNKTYYLDVKVIKTISGIAKKSKVSESKALNDILKHVLKIT